MNSRAMLDLATVILYQQEIRERVENHAASVDPHSKLAYDFFVEARQKVSKSLGGRFRTTETKAQRAK